MASANKPRLIGLNGIGQFLRCSITQATTSLPAATRLQQVASVSRGMPPTRKTAWREGHEHELTSSPATTTTTVSRKRTRDEEDHNGRPSKQARRDSAVENQIARFQQAMVPPPPAPPRTRTLAEDSGRRDSIAQLIEQQHRESAAKSVTGRAQVEKKQGRSHAVRNNPPLVKATACGLPPPKKSKAPASSSAETVHTKPLIDDAAPQCADTVELEQQPSAPPPPSVESAMTAGLECKLKKIRAELETERETTRCKSAQVLRLINANTDHKHETRQTIKGLETARDEAISALESKTKQCHAWETENTALRTDALEMIQGLRKDIARLTQGKADAIARGNNFEAEAKRLNDRNDYLQISSKNAADGELKAGNRLNQVEAQLVIAREGKDRAITERDAANEAAGAAEAKAREKTTIARALLKPLSIMKADVSRAADRLNADLSMDTVDEETGDGEINWRDLVELPSIFAPQPSAPSSAPKYTSSNLFGQDAPSGPISFGRPSQAHQQPSQKGMAAPHHADDDTERCVRELARELAAQKQQTSDLQAWAERKESGEQAPPPPNINQRAFEKYVDHLVTDKVINGMAISSGALPPVGQGGDVGMNDASPRGPSFLDTAYVDFTNAQTYGPDGGPMGLDDNAYHKSVSRQNAKGFSNERNGKHNNNAPSGSKFQKKAAWSHDPLAGKWKGLDIHMGHNGVPDHSKENQIGNAGGRKRKHEDVQNGSNKRGGKGDKPRGNQNKFKENCGGSANNGHGKADWNNNQSNNGAGSGGGEGGRGSGGFGGGRGGRDRGRGGGRGRGGSVSHDTVPGAEDPSTTDLDDRSHDDGEGPPCFRGGGMATTQKIGLGKHFTNQSYEQLHERSKMSAQEHREYVKRTAAESSYPDEDMPTARSPEQYGSKMNGGQSFKGHRLAGTVFPGVNMNGPVKKKEEDLAVPQQRMGPPQGIPSGHQAWSLDPRLNRKPKISSLDASAEVQTRSSFSPISNDEPNLMDPSAPDTAACLDAIILEDKMEREAAKTNSRDRYAADQAAKDQARQGAKRKPQRRR